MGYILRRWLADRLPVGLSSGERLVALEIADQASDKTRVASAPEVLETVARRAGLAGVKQVGKVLGKLASNGIELRVPLKDHLGQPLKDKAGRTVFACAGHRTTFRVPKEDECSALMVSSAGDHSAPERSPARETIEQKRSPHGETKRSPTEETIHDERSPARETKEPEWSPAGGTLIPQRTTSTTTSPAVAGDTDTSDATLFDEPAPAPLAAKAPKRRSASSNPAEPVSPDAFADFWKAYPRRTEKRDAVRAWNRAIGEGVPPERIVQAARAYAIERRGEPSKFTKYPATWLNKGCYDDEPAAPTPGRTGHQPYANPDDHDVYDEDMF